MSPLSVVPGRVRLESGALIGKRRRCVALAEKIQAIEGVVESDINPRTGRILIRFDAADLDSDALIAEVTAMLREPGGATDPPFWTNRSAASCFPCNRCSRRTVRLSPGEGNGRNGSPSRKEINDLLVHAVVDLAGHILMPKPLGLLLPIAVAAMRKPLRPSKGG